MNVKTTPPPLINKKKQTKRDPFAIYCHIAHILSTQVGNDIGKYSDPLNHHIKNLFEELSGLSYRIQNYQFPTRLVFEELQLTYRQLVIELPTLPEAIQKYQLYILTLFSISLALASEAPTLQAGDKVVFFHDCIVSDGIFYSHGIKDNVIITHKNKNITVPIINIKNMEV